MNSESPNDLPVSQIGGTAPKSQRGCLFYGCIFSAAAILLLMGVSTFFIFKGVQQFVKVVASVSEDHPRVLPVVQANPEEVQKIRDRLDKIGEQLESDAVITEPIELTELEINQLIQSDPQFKGKFYVDFEPDEIKGEVSLPLDDFSKYFKTLKGKYLNGDAEFTAEITRQGFLDVHLVNLTVGDGKTLPVNAMLQIKKENMAKEMNSDPKVVKVLKKMDRLEILKDRVRLVPRQAAAENKSEMPTDKEFDDAMDDFHKGADGS